MPRTHKKLHRLYVRDALCVDCNVEPDRAQVNYLAKVLRKKTGDHIILFNGRDGAWLAQINTLSRRDLELTCLEKIASQPEPHDLWYGFAPLKSARLDYMVQKATEMGVSNIQPVITRHTQRAKIKHQRMVANVIEAAEQCEVLQVPMVEEEVALAFLLENWEENHPGRILIFADEAAASASPLDSIGEIGSNRAGLLIGPEGGFSDEERELLLAQAFVLPISLGPRILRADTAAVVALGLIQGKIGDWNNHR
jgi:16S rRNA (uracil1498-N3)-methyltransferase